MHVAVSDNCGGFGGGILKKHVVGGDMHSRPEPANNKIRFGEIAIDGHSDVEDWVVFVNLEDQAGRYVALDDFGGQTGRMDDKPCDAAFKASKDFYVYFTHSLPPGSH